MTVCFEIHTKQIHPFGKMQKSRVLNVVVQNLKLDFKGFTEE